MLLTTKNGDHRKYNEEAVSGAGKYKISHLLQELPGNDTGISKQAAIFLAMEVLIRTATADDAEILLEFEQKIIEAERPFDDSLRAGAIHYYDLLELIRSPAATVLLAVAGDEVIGSGYAKILPAKPYQQYREYAYLGFMYVKPAFRGMGVNRKIIQSLLEWVKRAGLTEVRLDVYEENTAAKKSYQKIGFRPNLLEMRLTL